MKLFEQLKSNASRMAVYAILVATALCGIAAPVYALNGEKGDVEPAYMASTVKDRYKAFSGDTFYVAEYDTTYRQLRYNKGYDYLGAEAISYTSGCRDMGRFRGSCRASRCRRPISTPP